MDTPAVKPETQAADAAGAKLKVATFAVPLSGNKGSASMTLGLIDGLRSQGIDLEILVYSYYPERDREIARNMEGVEVRGGHPKHLIPLILLILLNRVLGPVLPGAMRRPYQDLRSCDVVLCVGGTTFADSMLYKVPWNVMAALPGWLSGRPFAFLSQTMGPFKKFWNRVCAKWTLKRARFIHGRGLESTRLVQEVIGRTDTTYSPDLSFMMDLDEARRSEALQRWVAEIKEKAGDRVMVGITPNTIVEKMMTGAGIDYKLLLAAIVKDLHAGGYFPVLIPHSYRAGTENRHNNDVGLCLDVIDQLDGSVEYVFVQDDLSSAELRLLVGELDFLVASRFHSMISALSQGTPPITIGWGAHKYTEVLDVYGLRDLYIPYQDADLNAVREKIRWLADNRAEVERKMEEGNARNLALSHALGHALIAIARENKS